MSDQPPMIDICWIDKQDRQYRTCPFDVEKGDLIDALAEGVCILLELPDPGFGVREGWRERLALTDEDLAILKRAKQVRDNRIPGAIRSRIFDGAQVVEYIETGRVD